MVTSIGNYVAGGNAEGRPLPSPPRERTSEEIAEWRARNEAKSRSTGIVRRTDQTPPAPALDDVVGVEPPPIPRPKPRPLPAPAVDERKARDLAIITAYTAGDTVPEIAKARGHSTATVRRVLREAGVEIRDDRATHSRGTPIEETAPELVEQVRELALAGELKVDEIAAEVGISPSTVGRIAKRNEIEFTRPRNSTADAERIRVGFSDYREEIAASGTTAAVLRAYATATGMKVGKVGLPGRAIFEAWLDAGKPTLEQIAEITPPPLEPAPEHPAELQRHVRVDKHDVVGRISVRDLKVGDLVEAGDHIGTANLDGRPHLHLDLFHDRGHRELLPVAVAKAVTDILDLIELARLAHADLLKVELEAAAGRILRNTVCPEPETAP